MDAKGFIYKNGKFIEIGTTAYKFDIKAKIVGNKKRVYQWKNYPEYCLNPNYNK